MIGVSLIDLNLPTRIALRGGPAKKRGCVGWTVIRGKEFVLEGVLHHGPKAWKHFFALTFSCLPARQVGYFFVSRQKSDKEIGGELFVHLDSGMD